MLAIWLQFTELRQLHLLISPIWGMRASLRLLNTCS